MFCDKSACVFRPRTIFRYNGYRYIYLISLRIPTKFPPTSWLIQICFHFPFYWISATRILTVFSLGGCLLAKQWDLLFLWSDKLPSFLDSSEIEQVFQTLTLRANQSALTTADTVIQRPLSSSMREGLVLDLAAILSQGRVGGYYVMLNPAFTAGIKTVCWSKLGMGGYDWFYIL